MLLLVIIFVSVVVFLALLSWALVVFSRRVLHNDLYNLSLTLVCLLIVQFILGMMSNLFEQIPKVEPWRVFHNFGPILLHTANATLILIFGFIFLYYSAIRQRKYPVLSRVGLASIFVAYASGVTFVNFGQNNVYSFTMALAFIFAFTTYAYIAFSSRK